MPLTVSSRGASKCRVTAVSTPSPTSAAGRTTVTSRPGWAAVERWASCSISSRSPTTLPSGSAPSGAASASGTGLSGAGAVHHRAGDQHTRPTRPAAAAVSTVCAPRTLNARRARASVSGRQVDVGVHDHVDPGQPAGQGRVADVDHPPGHPGHVAAVVVDGHHPADPVRGRQPGGQRVAQALRRPGDGHHRRRWPRSASPAVVVLACGRDGQRGSAVGEPGPSR